MKPSERLSELNILLPSVAAPVGSYVPALRSGSLIITSGQLPFRDGKLIYAGKVTGDVSLESAADGASIAVLNALAAAAQVADGIDAITQVVRVCVYVASSPGFTDQPQVANGASDDLSIVGPAADFCLVVTQRRHVDDTALTVTGDAAAEWMDKAQAYAGPASDGPALKG